MNSILVANLAGGVGRSITTQSLATAATEYGKRVLAIDADPSAQLTFLAGVENPRFTSLEFFAGQSALEVAGVKSYDRFTLVPSASRLATWPGGAIDSSLWSGFDLAFIDSPAGPSALISSLIEACDLIIAPVTRDLHSVRGLLHLRDFTRSLNWGGAIHLLDIARTEWDEELLALVRDEFKILEPAIRSDISVRDFQSSARSLLSFAPHSPTAADYREVTYGMLEELGLL